MFTKHSEKIKTLWSLALGSILVGLMQKKPKAKILELLYV